MPAGHCAAASDGEQEKDEGPLLTKEVKGTTDRKQAREGGGGGLVRKRKRDTEKENERNRKKTKKGTILKRIRPHMRERAREP